jgi:hypothetical protein
MMTNELFTLGAIEWFIGLIAFMLFIFSSEKRTLTSSVLAMAVIVILGGFQRYAPYLYQLAIDYPEYKKLWWGLWYFGFFLGDLLGLMAIKTFHAFYKLNYELAAKVIATSFFLGGLTELTMLIQRLQFDTQIAKTIYSASIMTINYGTVSIVLFLAIRAYYRLSNLKRGVR